MYKVIPDTTTNMPELDFVVVFSLFHSSFSFLKRAFDQGVALPVVRKFARGWNTLVTNFAADRAIGVPDLRPWLRSGCRSGTKVSLGEDPGLRRIHALNLALVSWTIDPGVYGIIC